ncbi:MAG TPA: hypothetical protein VNH44_18120 [Micropepsaceae bacterium]|nr:hypothetical protein [Micropepsaceae bacterium]
MSIPITGVLLIPLGMVLIFLPWRYCLTALMAFAMMSPAAVVNVGSFGLEPGYFLALLLIARTFVSVMTEGYVLNGFVLGTMRPLFYFVATTFVVLFAALCFFQGWVETLPGTSGFKSGATQPFHLARNNYTQIAYLFINLCLIYSLAHQGARRGFETLVRDWDRAIICGLLFAVLVCAWQFVSLYSGIYFPADFFYSNAGYSRADSQTMVGLFRINGPFEEPSTLGYTFTGFLLFAWLRYRALPSAFSGLMIAGCIFCMLVSTSTTAFVGLFMFGCLAVFDLATGRAWILPRKLSATQLMSVLFVFVGILLGSAYAAENWAAISIMLNNVLFNKAESTSFQQRAFADLLAVKIFVETYGIGVSLGSHKANSLMLTILSNTGIAGLVLFCSFIYGLFRARPAAECMRYRPVVIARALSPFQWGLAGLLVIHVFSNPNLSTLTLWVQIGGLLALQAALHRASAAFRSGEIAYRRMPESRLAVPFSHEAARPPRISADEGTA